MIDRKELEYIQKEYKQIKKAELLYAVEWLLDYIEDMELPSKRELLLEESIKAKRELISLLKSNMAELEKTPIKRWLWKYKFIRWALG